MCTIALTVALIDCVAESQKAQTERLAHVAFDQGKSAEAMRAYSVAVSCYEDVIKMLPGSALAKRAQDRLRTRPELVRAQADEAERKHKEAEAKRAAKASLETYAEAHPEYADAVLHHQISIGMSSEGVMASWGRPTDVNRTVTASGTRDQWVYQYGVSAAKIFKPVYVYFENGLVTSWQE